MTLSRRTFLTAAASLPLASCVPGIEPRAVQMALVPINAEEAIAFEATRRFQIEEVVAVFRVPPGLVDVEEVIRPWLERSDWSI